MSEATGSEATQSEATTSERTQGEGPPGGSRFAPGTGTCEGAPSSISAFRFHEDFRSLPVNMKENTYLCNLGACQRVANKVTDDIGACVIVVPMACCVSCGQVNVLFARADTPTQLLDARRAIGVHQVCTRCFPLEDPC